MLERLIEVVYWSPVALAFAVWLMHLEAVLLDPGGPLSYD